MQAIIAIPLWDSWRISERIAKLTPAILHTDAISRAARAKGGLGNWPLFKISCINCCCWAMVGSGPSCSTAICPIVRRTTIPANMHRTALVIARVRAQMADFVPVADSV